ncbi:MAG: enoyl-CoA hydratase/isomerase family protein [Gammaproteobacteria bacterium]|nr:enoyl-CoA hydratase/isomerase family protein [Gammaproteobacteria bacterium]
MSDTRVRIEGATGHITLQREKALNALNYPMLRSIGAALRAWHDDTRVRLVLIDAAGPRAFCAGGDVLEICRRARAGDLDHARRFWRDEYHVNALIGRYPKPYVALMHGITMGGGVGLSGHGSHRVVTDSTVLAMPEAAIGLLPDVGGTWLLARAPGAIGSYLAMTGERIGAADAMHAGFADCYVPETELPALREALLETADPSVLERFSRPPPGGVLAARQELIDSIFDRPHALDCARALRDRIQDRACDPADRDWLQAALDAIERNSPLSVAISHEAVRRARSFSSLEQSLALEFRFTWRSVEDSDFLEGIRAMLLDKDRRPRWADADLSGPSPARLDQLLGSLAEHELW